MIKFAIDGFEVEGEEGQNVLVISDVTSRLNN